MIAGAIQVEPVTGIGDVRAGDDLAAVIGAAASGPLGPADVLVVAQKIVSKAEGRVVRLADVEVTAEAEDLAAKIGKDPRIVQLILSESTEVVRTAPNILIVRHRLGLVMANAGIDQSNVSGEADEALLLPVDPDGSAARLREGLGARYGGAPAVIISDSFGRTLRASEVAYADAIAGAAGLAMGEAAEGIPAAIVRGLSWTAPDQDAAALVRPLAQDLFR